MARCPRRIDYRSVIDSRQLTAYAQTAFVQIEFSRDPFLSRCEHTHVNPSSASGSRNLTIALCFAVAVLEGFDIQALGIVAPRIARDLALTAAELGLVFAVGNIGLVVGAALGGGVADRWGRKPVLVGAVLMFGLFTLATVIVTSFGTLFAARLLAGIGFGAALPTMMALAAEVAPEHKRAVTTAAMFCGMPIGGGSAGLFVGALPESVPWQAVFVAGGVLPLLLAPALVVFLRETLHRAAPRDPSLGRAPSVWRVLFAEGRAAPTLLLWTAFFPTLLILYLMLSWLPSVVAAKGLDAASAPLSAVVFNYSAAAGAIIVSGLVDRFGMRWPLTLAYAGLVAALFALGAAESRTELLLFSGIAGFCVLGANYSLYGVTTRFYPMAMRGVGSGASVAAGRLGSVVGPMIAGIWLSQGATGGEVIEHLAPLAIVAGGAVLWLVHLQRRIRNPDPEQ
jgi:AAHS family 3-hydroxyphenylpropionic acid transporter